MTLIPKISLAKFITWKHLATRPLDYIRTDDEMPASEQSEQIQAQLRSASKEIQELGVDPESEEFTTACKAFEEEHGLENILFLILSDFEKDHPEMPDFGNV